MSDVVSISTVLIGAGSGVLVPFMNKLMGPVAEEASAMVSDIVRTFRLHNSIRLLNSTKKKLTEAGLEPKAVNLKLLLPILEHASLEEDALLAEKWASLLANAADPRKNIEVKPAFSDILRQMTPSEAFLMDRIYAHCLANATPGKEQSIAPEDIQAIIEKGGYLGSQESDVDNLVRNRLLVDTYGDTWGYSKPHGIFFLTAFGIDFMKSCAPPKADA